MLQMLSSLGERLEQAVGELVQSGLAIARGRPPDATYIFKHALVQDAAYASMLRERRRAIHLRLAEALEKELLVGGTTEPQLLAWHFAEAGTPQKAIDYYLKAAERATGRLALGEMVSHLRKGLAQLAKLPGSAERLRRELTLQVALGRVLIDHQGSGSDEVRVTFERARELCLSLDETDQLLRAHDGLLNYHFTRSEPRKLLHYASEMLDVGQKHGNPQALLMARRSAGLANLLLGRFEEALEQLELTNAMYDAQRDGPYAAGGLTTRDPKVSVSTVLGICLTTIGRPDSGAAASLSGIHHAEALNHMISLILGLRRACVEAILRRDAPAVIAHSSRLLAVDAEYETFLGTREGTFYNCWAQLQERQDMILLTRMQSSLEQLDAANHWVMLPFFLLCGAEVRGLSGDVIGASALLDRAAELVRRTGEQWCEPEILRLQARFSARDPSETVACLQSSLTRAREQGAKLWELRSATSLASLWCEQGQHAAARELLEPVYASYSEGLTTSDLVAARALLDQLDGALGLPAVAAPPPQLSA
jgi:predicted ATPase